MAEAKPALPILSWQDSFRVAVVFFCLDEAGPNEMVFLLMVVVSSRKIALS